MQKNPSRKVTRIQITQNKTICEFCTSSSFDSEVIFNQYCLVYVFQCLSVENKKKKHKNRKLLAPKLVGACVIATNKRRYRREEKRNA